MNLYAKKNYRKIEGFSIFCLVGKTATIYEMRLIFERHKLPQQGYTQQRELGLSFLLVGNFEPII